MSNDIYATIGTRRTPQTEQADERQAENNAGGWTFTIDDEARLRRFLIIGSEVNTYYQSAAELTKDNATIVLAWAKNHTQKLVDLIVEISVAGRAPRQQPGIFALAAAASLGDADGRRYALSKLATVCRTGTALFLFAGYVENFRGWGPALRRAVGDWYLRDVDKVAHQVVKYRQRGGWTHRDLLRLAHPKVPESHSAGDNTPLRRRALFEWITHGRYTEASPPMIIHDFAALQKATTGHEAAGIIADSANGLSWEMVPTDLLNEPKVWQALLAQGVPTGALLRQLPRLTKLGLARTERKQIIGQLTDVEQLKRARIHPMNVLVAAKTYAAGQGKGGEWIPDRHIVDALDDAFYAAFGAVEPAGKRTLLALDVSGSMSQSAGGLPISCYEAEAALALVTLKTEPECDVVGFTNGGWTASGRRSRSLWGRVNGVTELPISPRQRLDDVVMGMSRLSFGGTDCALPMLWAQAQGRVYDTICVFTDNETWAGSVHPHQALEEYRQHTGINTRFAVAAFTSTGFSIADPADPGSLDVVGLDSAVPNLLADFSRGDI